MLLCKNPFLFIILTRNYINKVVRPIIQTTGTEFPYLLRKCVPKYGNTDDGQISTEISKINISN